MPGFGLSAKPLDFDYPIAAQADACEALLALHGVTRPHVLAHDYGVTVAQELLAREREGRLPLASVCFLNGGLFPETHRARPVQKLLAHPWTGPLLARAISYQGFARTMRRIGGRSPPSEQDLRDLWWLMQQHDGRQALARLINYMEQRRAQRPRWVGALVDSTVPRRLLCGALDPVSGRHLAERYRELVPQPDVVVFDDLGHYPHLEDPAAVLGRLPRVPRCVEAQYSTNTLTRMSPMPISAAPAISPAQIGSCDSTQISCARVPGRDRSRRAAYQNSKAPQNIISDESGGSTTPRPIASGDSGKRFCVRTRSTSITSAAKPAIAIDQTIEVVSRPPDSGPPNTAATRSETPFHCTAAGNANLSLTMVSATVRPAAGSKRRARTARRTAAWRPARRRRCR